MAQFSIKEAVRFSFSMYRKHFLLLALASAFLGIVFPVALSMPHYISEQLGMKHFQLVHGDVASAGLSYEQAKADPSSVERKISQGIFSALIVYFQKNQISHVVLVMLITLLAWLLYLSLLVSCMKLGLVLVDKDSGSVNILFQPSVRQRMRFFAGTLFYGVYLVAVFRGFLFIGSLIESFIKNYLNYETFFTLSSLVWAIALVVTFYFLGMYVFYGYCVVDNPTIGVCSALKSSRNVTKGSVWRVVLAIFLFASVAASLGYLISALVLITGIVSYPHEIARFICAVVTTPFSIPYFSYIYRTLSRK